MPCTRTCDPPATEELAPLKTEPEEGVEGLEMLGAAEEAAEEAASAAAPGDASGALVDAAVRYGQGRRGEVR